MLGEDVSPIREEKSVFSMTTVLEKVFVMMALGLVVTGITSLIVISVPAILSTVIKTFEVWLIAELVLVIILSLNLTKMGKGTCIAFFYVYAIINGITLSSIFLVYELGSIASTFFIVACMFAGITLFAKVTKIDLTKFSSFFLMALIGLIIATVVDIFIKNSMLDFIVSVVGVILFIGITAYDIQKIESLSQKLDSENEEKMSQLVVWGALNLYLDFINIFLKLLRLFGKRKRN